MVPHNGPPAPRGRGAQSNVTGRFESQVREAFDDGWTSEDEAPAQLKTHVTPERAKTILSRNDSPDVGFDRSINPYRGCEHGCIYLSVTQPPRCERCPFDGSRMRASTSSAGLTTWRASYPSGLPDRE
jgi:hypothetical protein